MIIFLKFNTGGGTKNKGNHFQPWFYIYLQIQNFPLSAADAILCVFGVFVSKRNRVRISTIFTPKRTITDLIKPINNREIIWFSNLISWAVGTWQAVAVFINYDTREDFFLRKKIDVGLKKKKENIRGGNSKSEGKKRKEMMFLLDLCRGEFSQTFLGKCFFFLKRILNVYPNPN